LYFAGPVVTKVQITYDVSMVLALGFCTLAILPARKYK